jgi:glycosyltransferase involved in cell wall biosynthesis
MKDGGGIKVKLVEALALGKAVVSTSFGKAGVGVEHGRHLLIADSAEQFAAALLQLLGDFELRRRLGEAGRKYVLEEMSESQTCDQAGRILDYLATCPA